MYCYFFDEYKVKSQIEIFGFFVDSLFVFDIQKRKSTHKPLNKDYYTPFQKADFIIFVVRY